MPNLPDFSKALARFDQHLGSSLEGQRAYGGFRARPLENGAEEAAPLGDSGVGIGSTRAAAAAPDARPAGPPHGDAPTGRAAAPAGAAGGHLSWKVQSAGDRTKRTIPIRVRSEFLQNPAIFGGKFKKFRKCQH